MRLTRIIESVSEFPQLRELWNAIYTEGEPPRASRRRYTLFQSYAWNEIVARVFAERERPRVVVVESDSGAVVIPASVRRDHVSLLGEELFDYRDVLSTDDTLLDAAWHEVERLGLPVRVKAVRGERSFGESKCFAGAPWLPAIQLLGRNKKLERNLRLLRAKGCEVRSYTPELKPVSLKGFFHPYEAGSSRGHGFVHHSADERHGRGARAYKQFGEMVRRMYALKGTSENGSLFTDPLRIEAVVQMAQSADSELHTIENDGEVVATILTFIDGDVCRFYGTYFDERWAEYSPGVSLLYSVIRQAQERGLDFDFMTGEQPYKMRFASEVVPLYTVERAAVASLAA